MNHLFKTTILLIASALPFWIAARIVIYYLKRKRNERTQLKTELVLTIFFVYLLFVAALTVIPTRLTDSINPGFDDLNFIPLINSSKCFLPGVTDKPKIMMVCAANIIGNILMFAPLGMLLPFVSKRFHTLKSIFIFALLLSLSIEIIQFFSRFIGNFRVVDVDDIILNTLGALAGFIILRPFRKRKPIDSNAPKSNRNESIRLF